MWQVGGRDKGLKNIHYGRKRGGGLRSLFLIAHFLYKIRQIKNT